MPLPSRDLAGTAVGIIPATVIHTYFAAAIKRGALTTGEAAAQLGLALAAIMVLSVLPELVKLGTRAVARLRGR